MKASGKPTVAIYSQFAVGHIPAYHRLYSSMFTSQGCRVLDLAAPALSLGARVMRRIRRQFSAPGMDAWVVAARRVRKAEALAGNRADAVLLVYADIGFAHPAASPDRIPDVFPWPWAAVLNGPAAVRGNLLPFHGGERAFSARNCRAIVVTDPVFVGPCRQTWPGRIVLSMPETTLLDAPSPSVALKQFLSIAAGRRVVGLLGVVSVKKNVGAFLTLARRAERSHPDIVFVIAGDFSRHACLPEERKVLREELAKRPANCHLYPAPIPDGPEFNAWVAACDVIWLAYRDVVYKSNVLTKAACFRRPVLVSPGHVMARHVQDYRLGEVVMADDAEETQAALLRLLMKPDRDRNFSEYTGLNAPDRLDDTVRGLLAAFQT